MVPGTSEINKMGQSIEPSRVCSSVAAEGSKLGTGDHVKDQKATEKKLKTTRKKHAVNDKQKASSTLNFDASRIPKSNSMSCKDGYSRHLKQPIAENGVSVDMANNSKRASSVLPAYNINNLAAQRSYYSTTTNETLMPSQEFATSGASSRIPCNEANILPSGSRFDKNYPKMEKSCGSAFSTILLSRIEGPGVTENKFKGKSTGATVDINYKAEAFNEESSKDMTRQRRIISAMVDVNPGVGKDKSLYSTKPTKGMRGSSTNDKSKSGNAPPKKMRKCEASVLTGTNLHDMPSDITGDTNYDHKELSVAAGSVYTARENACSSTFWETMESVFAPATSQDISFLKLQLKYAENLAHSLMFGDEHDVVGGITKSYTGSAVSNLDQQSIKSTAFWRLNKPSNAVPGLFQRVLAALIDKDEGERKSSSNEGSSIHLQCMTDDLCLSSCTYTGSDCHCSKRAEFELNPEFDTQSRKCFPVHGACSNKTASSGTYTTGSIFSSFSNQGQQQADDSLSYSNAGILRRNNQKDLILARTSHVNVNPVFPFNCPYQMLSPNDKLSLELQSIGLNATRVDTGDGWIDQEIKRLEVDLYQKVLKVKNNLRKIGKGIECEQDLEKRNLDESALDQLVVMSYKRMYRGGRRKSSRSRKAFEQAALPFVKRTLARCKQFEDSGKSVFSQHNLLDGALDKPPSEEDIGPVECDGSVILDNKCKEARDNGKRKCSEIDSVLDAFRRPDSLNNSIHGSSFGLQQTSTQSVDDFVLDKWKNECLSQIVSSSFIRATNPSQVQPGFFGGVQPLSHPISPPSWVLPAQNRSPIEGKTNLLNAAKPTFDGRHGTVTVGRDSEIAVKETAPMPASASKNVCKSKAKSKPKPTSKPKRTLSRIGMQESSNLAKSLAPETADHVAEGNNELPSTVNSSHDVSSETRSIEIDASDPVKSLGETEDLSSWLNIVEEGSLDGDCVGLDVPMDDLSDVQMFF